MSTKKILPVSDSQEDQLYARTCHPDDPESQVDPEKMPLEPYYTEDFRNPGWLCAIALFLNTFILFGLSTSWGIFQVLYSEVYSDEVQSSTLTFVGSISSLCLLSLGPAFTPLLPRLGYRGVMAIGATVAPVGMLLSSFCNHIWQVMLTQGVFYGIGGACIYSISASLPSQWFFRRRGLVNGLATSGTGVGGLCLTNLIQALISSIGYRNAIRVLSCIMFVFLWTAVLLTKPRRPYSATTTSEKNKTPTLRELLSPNLIIFLVFAVFITFTYYTPFSYLAQYALYINLTHSQAAICDSMLSVGTILSRIGGGYVADKFGLFNACIVYSWISGISVSLLWQFTDNYTTLIVYSIIYGTFGGVFFGLVAPLCAQITGLENLQRTLNIVCMVSGVSIFLGPFTAGEVLQYTNWTVMIQTVVALTFAGALALMLCRYNLNQRVWAKV